MVGTIHYPTTTKGAINMFRRAAFLGVAEAVVELEKLVRVGSKIGALVMMVGTVVVVRHGYGEE